MTVGEVLGRKLGDIEDLFSVDDYLMLYNKTFSKKIKGLDLSGIDPLVKRIGRKENIDRFDHSKPARVLLKHQEELLTKLSEDTLSNFEKAFSRINRTLQN